MTTAKAGDDPATALAPTYGSSSLDCSLRGRQVSYWLQGSTYMLLPAHWTFLLPAHWIFQSVRAVLCPACTVEHHDAGPNRTMCNYYTTWTGHPSPLGLNSPAHNQTSWGKGRHPVLALRHCSTSPKLCRRTEPRARVRASPRRALRHTLSVCAKCQGSTQPAHNMMPGPRPAYDCSQIPQAWRADASDLGDNMHAHRMHSTAYSKHTAASKYSR